MAVELATAYVTLLPSMQGIQGQVATAMAPVGGIAAKTGDEAGKKVGGGIAAGIKGAALTAGAFFAVDRIASFFKGANEEALESQRIGRITEQVIRSTGGTANVTADQVGNLANALSVKAGVDDEVIQQGANLLLTFKNVANQAGEGADIFDRATGAAVDLSAAGFGSVDSAAKMLGKALNDPVAGLTALGRAGVTFTDAQKEQIKAMVEAGDTLGAQKLIMAEVESQVGGVAAASASGADKMRVAWGNFQEMAGTLLLPVLERLQVVGTAAFTWASQNQGAVTAIAAVIAGLVGILITYEAVTLGVSAAQKVQAVATGIVTAAQWLWNAALTANPIGIVIVAIAALVAALVFAWHNSETFRAVVTGAWEGIKAAASAVGNWFTVTVPAWWNGILASTRAIWGNVVGFFGGLVGSISGAIGRFVDVVRTVFSYTPLGIVISNFGAIVSFIGGIPGRIVGALGDLGGLLYNAGVNVIEGLARGIRSAVSRATSAVSGVVSAVRDFLPFSPAKRGPFSGRGWSFYSGQSVANDFARGLASQRGKGADAASAFMGEVAFGPVDGGTLGVAGGRPGRPAAGGGDTINVNGHFWTADEVAAKIQVAKRDRQAVHGLTAIATGV